MIRWTVSAGNTGHFPLTGPAITPLSRDKKSLAYWAIGCITSSDTIAISYDALSLAAAETRPRVQLAAMAWRSGELWTSGGAGAGRAHRRSTDIVVARRD